MAKRAKDCNCKEREGYRVYPGADGYRHTMWCGTVNRRDEENWGSSHYGWSAIDTNEPWPYSFKGGKKSIREAMLEVNKAFKNLVHAFAEVLYPVFDRILDWIYPPKGKK